MLITCPTCASAYQIEAEKVGLEGRSVRCAACRETWFIAPADVLAAHAADLEDAADDPRDPVADAAWAEATAAVRAAAETAPEPYTEPQPGDPAAGAGRGRHADPARPGRRMAGLSPALALGLAALAALPLACLGRASVVRALPQTASVYAALGLPVNLRGIEIRDVVAYRNPGEDGRPAELVVEGDLVGIGRSDASVPALAVEVSDGSGRPLRTFTAVAPRAVLGAGETARFRASLIDPPGPGRAVDIRFADAAPSPIREAARH